MCTLHSNSPQKCSCAICQGNVPAPAVIVCQSCFFFSFVTSLLFPKKHHFKVLLSFFRYFVLRACLPSSPLERHQQLRSPRCCWCFPVDPSITTSATFTSPRPQNTLRGSPFLSLSLFPFSLTVSTDLQAATRGGIPAPVREKRGRICI